MSRINATTLILNRILNYLSKEENRNGLGVTTKEIKNAGQITNYNVLYSAISFLVGWGLIKNIKGKYFIVERMSPNGLLVKELEKLQLENDKQ